MGMRYTLLSVDKRRKIERWRSAKIFPVEMARVLGRYRSTIFRELRRNHFVDRCMPRWPATSRCRHSCRRRIGMRGGGSLCGSMRCARRSRTG